MEQNKKLFSTILLSVGVLFIIVSGAIFISQNWAFLPEELKKIFLFLATALMFTGSIVTEVKWNLKKSSLALYYMGTLFVGYSVLSTCMYFHTSLTFMVSASLIGMLLPTTLHFVKTRNAFDFLLEVLLADGLLFCLFTDLNMECFDSILLPASAVSLALTGFMYYLKKEAQEHDSTYWVAASFYGVHGIYVLMTSFFYLFEKDYIYINAIAVSLVMASLTVLYLIYRTTFIRVMQSMLISYTVLVFANCLRVLLFPDKILCMIFLAFVVNVGIMVILNRKEMFYGYALSTISLIFILTADIVLTACFGYTNDAYYPFATVFALGMILKYMLREKSYDLKKLLKWVGSLVAIDATLIIATCNADFACHNCFLLILAIACLQLGILFNENSLAKATGRFFALFFTLLNFSLNPLLPVKFYDQAGYTINFTTEHTCILIGIGIVLFGIIWYHNNNSIRWLQFIGFCMELTYLLIFNMAEESLPHILFLGIGSFLCLLVCVGLKLKNYTIAFAITLVLIVLYLTKAVWMSIAWWVYLFLAGIVLVFLAIRREKVE